MKVLITGFEPFGGREYNQSEQLASELARLNQPAYDLLILPVSFRYCFSKVSHWLSKAQSSGELLVFSLGEAPVEDLQFEHIGLNRMHSHLREDNDGDRPTDQVIFEESPLALSSSFSPEKLIKHFSEYDGGVKVSYSAGQYVCNALLFSLLAAQDNHQLRSCFFHIPVDPSEEKKISIITRLNAFIKSVEKGEI